MGCCIIRMNSLSTVWIAGCFLFGTLVAQHIVHRSEYGSLGLNLLVDPPEAEIDIVAVHGLDGHWRRSWTADNGVFWLQDLLPIKISSARIYSFSHDSRTRGSEVPLTLDISDHGKKLVSDLTITRALTGTERRPIIFVGHSLGGLIVKSALLHSDMARVGHLEEQKAVKLSTFAVLFLGTPHQGANGVSIAQAVTKVLSVISHTNNKLLGQMKPDSHWLRDLQTRYNAISQDIKTVYYYETKEMPVPGLGRLLVVPKFSAVVFGAVNAEDVGLDADHSTIAKYAELNDPNLQDITKRIVLFSRHSTAAVQTTWYHWLLAREKPKAHQTRYNPDSDQVYEEFRVGVSFKGRPWNPQFTGRNRTLQLMDEILQPIPRKDELHVGVIYGPGGVGKTQLSLEYTRRHRLDYSSIFWNDADRQDTVEASVARCVKQIQDHYTIQGLKHSPRFDALSRCDEYNTATCLDPFLMWLAHEDNRSWLIIFDNHDDLESVRLRELLPNTAWGSVLITSRRSDLAISWDSVEISVMEREEALELLQRSSQSNLAPETQEWRSAQMLAQRLAYLPLALSQAGTYIAMHRSQQPFATYLELFQKYPREILGKKARKAEWDAKDDTILTTWEISYIAVQERMPEASQILLISGNLDHDNIPQRLFTFGDFLSELQVQQALGILFSFSFIRPSVGTDTFSVHPLIHLWARLRLSPDQQEAILQTTLTMVYEYLNRDHGHDSSEVKPHAHHLYSVYTHSGPFACIDPEQHLNPIAVWDDSHTENFFNLYPYGKTIYEVLSYVRSFGITLMRVSKLGSILQPSDQSLAHRELEYWYFLHRYISESVEKEGEDSKDLSMWMFCRATRLFPTENSLTLDILILTARHIAFVRTYRDCDSQWYASFLKWYAQSIIRLHPATASLHLGHGLAVQNCPSRFQDLDDAYGSSDKEIDIEEFNHRHDEIDKCIAASPGISARHGRLSRSIMSWGLAVRIFCLHERWSPYQETKYLWGIASDYTRSAKDPLSQAVLSGLTGSDESTVVPYMLLHLLEWKGPTCLRAWPSSLSYLAKYFRILAGTEIGSLSINRLTESWHYEHGDGTYKMECYHYERCGKNGGPECCRKLWKNPLSCHQCQVTVECSHEELRNDLINEPSCQMGHLSSYLSMWHAGMGDVASSRLWLSNMYAMRLGMPKPQWHKPCGIGKGVQRRRQVRLSFLDEEEDFLRQSNYDTDGLFDYVAHVTVDLLRGFHHRSITEGLFTKEGVLSWPEISQFAAWLILRPSLNNAASLDNALADFLMLSGRRPDDALSQAEQVLQVWDTYGRK